MSSVDPVASATAHSRARESVAGITLSELESLASACSTAADRVELICDLMSDLEWHPKRLRQLASVWGITRAGVQQYSTEAHRRTLSHYRGHEEEIVGRLCAAIDRTAQVALNRKRHVLDAQGDEHTFPDPDTRTVIQAQLALAQVLGLMPNKHEVEIRYSNWDDEVLVSRLVEMMTRSPKLLELLVKKIREIAPHALQVVQVSGGPDPAA